MSPSVSLSHFDNSSIQSLECIESSIGRVQCSVFAIQMPEDQFLLSGKSHTSNLMPALHIYVLAMSSWASITLCCLNSSQISDCVYLIMDISVDVGDMSAFMEYTLQYVMSAIHYTIYSKPLATPDLRRLMRTQ